MAPAATSVGFIGKRLGRFSITGELGRGGMATVYRARDPELGRDVALKVMHGFFAGRAELEARFRREAGAIATIRHPSILNVFDFAPPSGEEPAYIVSELIEGPSLSALAESRGGRLRPEIAALIVVRVAEALGAAHAAGIVHRDVKSDNVLIERSGAGGRARVVLTDFGVAHINGLDTMTATGAVLGSPAYMSPEQARSEEVGAASDVFSLGVMFYHLCTGHLPFSGKDPLAVITAILRGQYRRPSEIEPRVGPDLERIITRCLQPIPSARFPDGAAVAAAIRVVLGEARATGRLDDEEAALREFLDHPGEFEAAWATPIARAATASAEQAHERGQIPRALAEVGRALAYVPDYPEAKALLGRLGARSRLRLAGRRALAVGGALLLVGALVGAWRHQVGAGRRVTSATPDPMLPVVPVTITQPRSPSALPSSSLPPAAQHDGEPMAAKGVATPAGSSRRARTTVTDAEREPNRHRPKLPVLAGAPARGEDGRTIVSAIAAAPSPSPSAEVVAPRPLPAAGEPAASIPAPGPRDTALGAAKLGEKSPVAGTAALASVVLRASYGFCEPSLDAQAPSLRASYTGLSPGPHAIFCTMPQGGPKLRVATYELRPGARTSLVIVPGPDGRPIIGRSE